jgi:hypothetical protein
MGIGEQGNLDLERDQSGGDIVGTCKGNRDMQERFMYSCSYNRQEKNEKTQRIQAS